MTSANNSGDRRWTNRRIGRRGLLRGAATGGAGVAGLWLLACGSDSGSKQDSGASQGAAGTGVAGGAAPVQRSGDVKTAYAGNFTQLDPTTGSGGTDHQALWPVFDNLVAYDKDFNLSPERSLAESWEIVDKTTIRLKLRQGVQFQDGTPFNAAAVRRNVEHGKQGKTSTVKADLGAVERVEAVDDATAVLVLSRPFSPLLRVLGDRSGMMISPKAIEASGANLDRKPVGAGPFKFVEEVLDKSYKLEAFDGYWKAGCPTIKTVSYQLGATKQQQVNALLAGQMNVIWDPDPKEHDRLKGGGMRIDKRPTPQVGVLFFNPTLPPWDNVHARRAVQYAIDRDKLVKVVWDNLHEPATKGWLGPATGAYYDPNFPGYSYNPAKVREELQLAKLPNGFEFAGNLDNSPATVEQGEFIQSNLAPFGIKMQLQPKPAPDYFREYYDVKVGSFVAGMSARADPWQQINYVHGAGGPFDVGAIPRGGDAQMERIFTQVAESYDEKERIVLMRKLSLHAEELAWFVKLYYNTASAASHASVKFEMFADGKPHWGLCDVSISR